jgi:hypothetical protein
MRRSGLTWTLDTLTAFGIAPQGVVKGSRMLFGGLRSRSDAEAIVAYLGTLQPPAKPRRWRRDEQLRRFSNKHHNPKQTNSLRRALAA